MTSIDDVHSLMIHRQLLVKTVQMLFRLQFKKSSAKSTLSRCLFTKHIDPIAINSYHFSEITIKLGINASFVKPPLQCQVSKI